MFDFLIPTVHAATDNALTYSETYNLHDIIRVGVSLVVLIAGLCAVGFILWGGVMLVLSGGKDDKVKPAINSIRYAVIGIIIIIISILILPQFGDVLGLNVSSYLSPSAIATTVQELASKIFGAGGGTVLNSSSSF